MQRVTELERMAAHAPAPLVSLCEAQSKLDAARRSGNLQQRVACILDRIDRLCRKAHSAMSKSSQFVVPANVIYECLALIHFNEELGQRTPKLEALKQNLTRILDAQDPTPTAKEHLTKAPDARDRPQRERRPSKAPKDPSLYMRW